MSERILREYCRPLALAAVAFLSSLLASPAGAEERDVEGTVEAEVTAVAPLRAPGRGMPWRARVTVRLDDGTRVRLKLGRPFPRVGERVQLRQTDGSLRPVR